METRQRRELSRKLPGDAAAKAVLRRLLQVMERNETGILADAADESLHDFRVAVRQTRTLLRQLRGVLPAAAVSDYRRRFKWLGSISAAPRDLQVYLEQFDGLAEELPRPQQAQLAPLRAHLAARRESEHARVTRVLRSPRYRRLKQGWTALLAAPAATARAAPRATLPIADIVGRRILKLYRRIAKQGAAITTRSPAAALHELRKECKQLRYLILLFRELYPPKKTRRLLDRLAALQDCLGAHQDAYVQIDALYRFEREMADAGGLAPETRRGIASLRRVLARRGRQARAEFGKRFEDFARRKSGELYRELFGTKR